MPPAKRRKPPKPGDYIATTTGVFKVLDEKPPAVFIVDGAGTPLVMQFYAIPRGWVPAPRVMVVRGNEPLGLIYLPVPSRPKGVDPDWEPILQDWEDLADKTLSRLSLPTARAFTYTESYLEGDEGSPDFRKKVEDSGATFIAWIV